jgi:hypothetical protein
MKPEGSYEVFVLLDHASDLVGRDESISGTAALDIAAGHAIAADLAHGVPEAAVELPASVQGCVELAVRRVQRWDTAQLSTEGLLLVMLLLNLSLELGRG